MYSNENQEQDTEFDKYLAYQLNNQKLDENTEESFNWINRYVKKYEGDDK